MHEVVRLVTSNYGITPEKERVDCMTRWSFFGKIVYVNICKNELCHLADRI